MKKIHLILVILVSISSCKKNKSEPAAISDPIFETIRIDRYSIQNGNPDSLTLSSYILKAFDNEGYETKSTYYSSDNAIMMQFVNQYDKGNKTRVNWIDSNDSLVKYVKNSYNENNKIVKSESFSPTDEFLSGFIHRWKDNGKLEEKGPIISGKEFKPNAFYHYNDQNEFDRLKEYDENDSLYAVVQWKYMRFDDNNEWIERHMITNDTLNRVERRIIRYKTD